MTTYVGLLRAINVGGTGMLPMTELAALCEGIGFTSVKTYIQSGNVVFGSALPEPKARARLQAALTARMGKDVGVTLRTAAELEAVLAHNPFAKAPPNRVIVLFLNDPPPRDVLAAVEAPGGEQLALGARELYLHYPDGQGKSKLAVPLAKVGTGRNLNTVARLTAMARALGGPAPPGRRAPPRR